MTSSLATNPAPLAVLAAMTNGSVPPPLSPISAELHPGPLLRRNWVRVLATTLVTAVAILGVLQIAPSVATARVQLLVTGPGAGPLVDEGSGPSPQEWLQTLIVDLESTAVRRRAADDARVPVDAVRVNTTTERDALVVELSVTAPSEDDAIALAGGIPRVVFETRRERSRAQTDEVTSQFRDQATVALQTAAELQARLPTEGTSAPAAEVFQLEQERDALVAQYERLLSRAAEIELAAPTRNVGFAITGDPELAPGRFPPPRRQALVLAIAIGIVAGTGVVMARPLIGRRLQREDMALAGDRHLGLLTWHRHRLARPGLDTVAAQLRALPELHVTRSRLVAVLALRPASHAWTVSVDLGRALADSGLDVAVLAIDVATSSPPASEDTTLSIEVTEVGCTRHGTGGCRVLRAHRHGGSALGAVHSGEIRAAVQRLRDRHELVIVDPTGSGVDGWVESAMGPDLVLVTAVEDRTTRDQLEAARSRLARAKVPAASVLVEPTIDLGRRLRPLIPSPVWSARRAPSLLRRT